MSKIDLKVGSVKYHIWTKSRIDSPTPRFGHSAVTFGTKMFIFGGSTGTMDLSDCWEYNFGANDVFLLLLLESWFSLEFDNSGFLFIYVYSIYVRYDCRPVSREQCLATGELCRRAEAESSFGSPSDFLQQQSVRRATNLQFFFVAMCSSHIKRNLFWLGSFSVAAVVWRDSTTCGSSIWFRTRGRSCVRRAPCHRSETLTAVSS
jgi:hypothetical protein